MRIQYNQGLFTQNRYNQTNTELNKALNKLSSGYKINQAADDAAGLNISEEMRAQIRGLNQAGENIQDGISLLKVADGGMGNIIDPNLQRIRELAVQSANDTLTDDDREKIQEEVNQIIQGIDNIANHTEFNGMQLLAGKTDLAGNSGGSSNSLADYVHHITETGGVTEKYNVNGVNYASAIIDFSNITSADAVKKLAGTGVNYTCCTCNKAYSIKFVDGNPDTSRLNATNPVMEVDISTLTTGKELVDKIIETAYGQAGYVFTPTPNSSSSPSSSQLPANATSFVKHYSQLAVDNANEAKIYIYDNRSNNANQTWPRNGSGVFNLGVYGEASPTEENLVLPLEIQLGSNSDQNTLIAIPNMTIKKLGIETLFINTQQNADLAIPYVDKIIQKVSNARSFIGAHHNRLEHAYNNVKNTEENLMKAESQLRDADMAKEISKLKKNQILLQSSQSMMAQINQMGQGVLEILG